MLRIFRAITGAVAGSVNFIIIRKHITTHDPRVLNTLCLFTGGVLLLAVPALRGFLVIGPDYSLAVVISGILNIIGLFLIFRAMVSSDMLLSLSMLSFTPAFFICMSYLLLHEVPSASGILGICFIVSGAYVLNISAAHEHFLDPVRSMVRNRGSWHILIVAVFFAASINYDKIAMRSFDPVFGMAFILFIISGVFSLFCGYHSGYTGARSVLSAGVETGTLRFSRDKHNNLPVLSYPCRIQRDITRC